MGKVKVENLNSLSLSLSLLLRSDSPENFMFINRRTWKYLIFIGY